MRNVLLGSLLVVVAASNAWSQSKTDPTLDKLAAAFTQAFNDRDAARVAAFYADNAVLMPPDQPLVQGRSNIETHYRSLFAQNPGTLKFVPIESAITGAKAYQVGTSTLTTGNSSGLLLLGVGGGARVRAGKYTVLYQRVQNEWMIVYDIFNWDAPTK